MTSFDYVVLTIIGVSVVLSMMRGFVREVIAILSWVGAFYVAKNYSLQILPLIPNDIPTEQLRVLAAFLIIFLATLLLASLLGIALSAIIKKAGLGWMNRLLGAFFGVARGLLIVCILVFLAGLTSASKDIRWQNAMFSAPLEALVISLLPWLPKEIAQHVQYE